MGFFTYLPYIVKGAQVISILVEEVPKILEDEKITVSEAMDLLTKALSSAGSPIEIAVPYEIREMSMPVKPGKAA